MAKYKVIEAPGYPGPTGFVRPGGTITLPDSAVPSRSFVPLDEPARKALTKAKMLYVEGLEQRMAELDPPKKLNAKKKRDLLFVPEIPAPKKAADSTEPEDGEELDAGREKTVAEVGEEAEPPAAEKGKGRAADTQ